MKIIALYGHAQCGKSTTLNYVKEMLREEGKSLSQNPPHKGDKPETFEYKGLIVCVAPGGDTEGIIQNNIAYFERKQCDVAITASRTRGAGVRAIEHYATIKSATLIWIKKSYDHHKSRTEQEQQNLATAHSIVEEI